MTPEEREQYERQKKEEAAKAAREKEVCVNLL
jgi:hypothetical protein